MARTNLPITQLAGNGGITAAPTAIDVTNGFTIAASRAEWTILVVSNTDTSAHSVTVVAGDPVGGTGIWPNQVVSVPASGQAFIGPFESARVQQKDGSIQINFVSGHTGTVSALQMPRGV